MTKREAAEILRTRICVNYDGLNQKQADDLDEAIDMGIEALRAFDWIPCSERQPEEAGLYQVTNTKPGARRVDWNIWMPECEWLYDTGVIAWMKLPEPYEG